jgi:hypothetical protein
MQQFRENVFLLQKEDWFCKDDLGYIDTDYEAFLPRGTL